ncbi:MAG: hypothetical protein M0Z93_07820, partial [Actinomycetota bacterium]|nr:hypothetical protein [Actinomycetota bacterium]
MSAPPPPKPTSGPTGSPRPARPDDEFFARGPETGGEPAGLVAETSEGDQELRRRKATGPGELRREAGAVLRLPEGHVVDSAD